MRHTITVLVENRFGVLTRIAGLFSGRGFNIDTLNVGPTHRDDTSRMTIVVKGDDRGAGPGDAAAEQAGGRDRGAGFSRGGSTWIAS